MIFRYNLTAYSLTTPKPHPDLIGRELGQGQNRTEPRFDIQVNHGIYREAFLSRIMKLDTVYVATLRHPFFRARSSAYFFGKRKHLSDKTIEKQFEESIMGSSLTNSMFTYFGFNQDRAMANQSYFRECADHIHKKFVHIIITELYDESLVLLRHKMCWTLKDIIYVSHKNLSLKFKAYIEKEKEHFDKLHKIHRQSARLDYDLYEHFAKVHQDTVRSRGKRFYEELAEYREIKDTVSQFCQKIYSKLRTGDFQVLWKEQLLIAEGKFTDAFTVTSRECIVLALDERNCTSMKRVLNYPIICLETIKNVKVHPSFCPEKNNNKTGLYVYNNTVFIPESVVQNIDLDL